MHAHSINVNDEKNDQYYRDIADKFREAAAKPFVRKNYKTKYLKDANQQYADSIIAEAKRGIEALETIKIQNDKDRLNAAIFQNHITQAYLLTNNYETAIIENKRGLEILEKLNQQNINDEYIYLYAAFQSDLGLAYAGQNKHEAAIMACKHGIEKLTQIDEATDKYYQCIACFERNIGLCYERQYDYELAEEGYLNALNVLNKIKNQDESVIAKYGTVYSNLRGLFSKNTDAYQLLDFAERVCDGEISPCYDEFARIYHQVTRKKNVNKDYSDYHHLLQFMRLIQIIIPSPKMSPENEFVRYLKDANHFKKFGEQLTRLEQTLSDLLMGSSSLLIAIKMQMDSLKNELAETRAQCVQLQAQLTGVKAEKEVRGEESGKSALVANSLTREMGRRDAQDNEERIKINTLSLL